MSRAPNNAASRERRRMVFDGLPHAFWAYILAPEFDEAFRLQAKFLKGHLAR